MCEVAILSFWTISMSGRVKESDPLRLLGLMFATDRK